LRHVTSSTYSLNCNAFLCSDGPYWVVLDLARDRYICLEAERFARLTPRLAGWEPAPQDVSLELNSDSEQFCRELASHGVLTQDARDSKPVRPEAIAAATVSLVERGTASRARLSPRALVAFVAASARAHIELKRRPIAEIVHRVQTRKQRLAKVTKGCDSERAGALVSEFELLRPYFPRPYLCLFDSLALLELLARVGIYPQWVFGIRAEPFGAHCWLQMGDVVINDSMDKVVEYRPIMAI
jgi:hypothetical protein